MGRVYIEVDAFFVIGIMASTKASNTALKKCVVLGKDRDFHCAWQIGFLKLIA